MLLDALVALLSFLGGSAAAAIFTGLFSRRKQKAETKRVKVETDLSAVVAAEKIINLYDRALHELQSKVAILEDDIRELRAAIQTKDEQIAELKARLGE